MNNIEDCTYGVILDGVTINQTVSKSYLVGEPNKIKCNNFKNIRFHALFKFKTVIPLNQWDKNYWGRARMIPKFIPGFKMITGKLGILSKFQFDYRPAQEPYDIP